jgi:hypothetical protein
MRQMPNRRKKARGRPHTGQRLYFCTGNLVGRFALAINDFLAILYLRKGNPNKFKRYFPSSSVGAVVMMVIFMPLTLSILS